MFSSFGTSDSLCIVVSVRTDNTNTILSRTRSSQEMDKDKSNSISFVELCSLLRRMAFKVHKSAASPCT